ncbi:MAG: DUF423 domain-containing protein [Pirellulaceae bacterium]|nr:DUF423 domain-containing protein [Pirellulaceae bacterium]
MKGRIWLVVGAILGALGVIMGAFGSHLLKEAVGPARLETWEIAVRYHLLHAVALTVVGVLATRKPGRWLTVSGACFTLGVAVFSGLLYALTLSQVSILGAIVPVGGLLLISGWVALAVAAASDST